MSAVRLRPARKVDSDFCFRLHRAAMRTYVEAVWGWDDAVQREFHDQRFDPAMTRIITVDGLDAGSLNVQYRPDDIYLARIEIHPDFQGRGIGSQLIRRLVEEAAERDQPVVLDVLTVNSRARALYRRLGFREVCRYGENEIKIRMRKDRSRHSPN